MDRLARLVLGLQTIRIKNMSHPLGTDRIGRMQENFWGSPTFIFFTDEITHGRKVFETGKGAGVPIDTDVVGNVMI